MRIAWNEPGVSSPRLKPGAPDAEGLVARELARIVLPVGMYTQFYVTYNARSLMNFIRLRTGEGAQSEIRLYAEALCYFFERKMPWTYDAFKRFVLQAKGN